ncbi:MAG TPA: serine hydrolase domain-containing protein [Vicinamibacteria bacterium]|jgi:CubicO group peptidase (beta-lactamase class C family)|nr:serine hydrolase domain-containing protein [Vicinamibacteria bacterium]
MDTSGHFARIAHVLVFSSAICGRSQAADPGALVSGAPGARLDSYFEGLETGGFSGTVLVARKGKLLLHKGYGLADRRGKLPCTTETVFDIGSITKQFTAAAILKLEMAGKLRVEDPLAKHLEGVPEDKAGVTLHHLLTHTSGLDHYYGKDDEYAPRDLAVRLFLRMPLITPSGAKYRYSNAGYSLLAAVVEKLSGKPYEAYLREVFFEPTGMTKTGYILPRWNVLELSRNYNGETDNGWTFNRNWGPEGPYWHLFGNGGILTTSGDLYKWEQALMSDRVLSPEARRKLWTPHVPESDTGLSSYGYGWRVGKTDHGTAYSGHGGGSSYGVAAAYFRFPDDGLLMIVLSNQAGLPGRMDPPAWMERVASVAAAP